MLRKRTREVEILTPPPPAPRGPVEVKLMPADQVVRAPDGTELLARGYRLILADRPLRPDDEKPVEPGVWFFRLSGLSQDSPAARSRELAPMREVLLRHEPSNILDRNAIQVVLGTFGGVVAGYVPAPLTPRMLQGMTAGGQAFGMVARTFSAEGAVVAAELLTSLGRELRFAQ